MPDQTREPVTLEHEPASPAPTPAKDLGPEKNWTTAVYALQALALIPLALGVTYLVAVIINYVKIDDVRGTWLESHFRWQIRTFWYSVIWGVLGWLTIFIFVGFVVLGVASVWVVYRIIKGWIRLSENKAMYTLSVSQS